MGPCAAQKLLTLQTISPQLQGLEGVPNEAARAGGFPLRAGHPVGGGPGPDMRPTVRTGSGSEGRSNVRCVKTDLP